MRKETKCILFVIKRLVYRYAVPKQTRMAVVFKNHNTTGYQEMIEIYLEILLSSDPLEVKVDI